MTNGYKRDFIEFLVKNGALKFGEFTTKSGRQSPYFINTGMFHGGESTWRLGSFYADALASTEWEFDCIYGPAYKGIPLAVSTCLALWLNYEIDVQWVFNRKQEKDHGDKGLTVGAKLASDSKVVILDDVITAGTSARESIEIMKEHGDPHISGMMISVDRMERGMGETSAPQEIGSQFGIEVQSIVNAREIIELIHGREINGVVPLGENEKERMEAYLKEYAPKG